MVVGGQCIHFLKLFFHLGCNSNRSSGWHSDDERLFQGKFRDCRTVKDVPGVILSRTVSSCVHPVSRIISLSLGATRKFELRRNWPEDWDGSRRVADGALPHEFAEIRMNQVY